MLYLSLSCLSLILGPLLYRYLSHSQRWYKMLDGFIFITIGGLVFTHIIPELIYHGGYIALACIAVGVLGPTLGERLFHRHSALTHNITIALGAFGLILHTLTDGGAILLSHHENDIFLALGIFLHRIPEGLAIWWMIKPHFGSKWAIGTLTAMVIGTIAGYMAGAQYLHLLNIENSVYLQAFVTGWILHVLLHQPHETSETKLSNQESGWGAFIGLIFLILLFNVDGTHQHQHDFTHHIHQAGPQQLLNWALTIAPWLLLSYCITCIRISLGITYTHKNLYIQWLQKSIGPEALILTLALLGWKIALIQASVGLSFSLLFGYQSVALMHQHKPKKLGSIQQQILIDIEHSVPWISFSLIMANLIGHPHAFISQPWIQMALVALIILPMQFCFLGATVFSIALAWSGWDICAVILPMIAAPIINITQLKNMNGQQGVFAMIIVCIALIICENLFYLTTPDMKTFTWVNNSALTIILGIYSVILINLGPRVFVSRLFSISIMKHHHHH